MTETLNPDAVKLAAARKVMGKALDRIPAHMRGELLERIDAAIERGNLQLPVQLPTPKVAVRSIKKQQAPSQSRDVEQGRTR